MGLRFLWMGLFLPGCSLVFSSSDLRNDGSDGGSGGAATGGSGGAGETGASSSTASSSSVAMSSSSSGVVTPCGDGFLANDEVCDPGVPMSTGLCALDCSAIRECPDGWSRPPEGDVCFRVLAAGPGATRSQADTLCEEAGVSVLESHPELRPTAKVARVAVAKTAATLRFLYCLGELPTEPFCVGYEVGQLDVIGWIGATNLTGNLVAWDDGTISRGPWNDQPQSPNEQCVVVYQQGLHEVSCSATIDNALPTRPTCELLIPVSP